MLKCYPVQFQNNLTVSLIVLHCARMSGAAFLLPFEIFLLLVLLGESWWGGGRGVVELFTHLILKPQKQNLFKHLCYAFVLLFSLINGVY